MALALRRDLKEQADVTVGSVTTRHQLRLAMLQYPLHMGPTEELQWFVAETDALTKLRDDTPTTIRKRLLTDTRHWVLRDLRTTIGKRANGTEETFPSDHPVPVAELIERFGASTIELWSADTWEEFTLRALWRKCRNGMLAVPQGR